LIWEEDGRVDGTDNVDGGAWLVEHRADLDRGEAVWLERLARFDSDGLWALDGHFCCATWLVWRTNIARSTAFEKLRVAHELCRRPAVAEAFGQGRLSYSAVRAITRMDRPAPEVDEALVELAASGQASILDVEKVVRSYILYADQDRPPGEDRRPARDVKIRRGDQGRGQIVITLGDVEIEEFAAALQAFIDLRYRPEAVDESSSADSDRPSDQRPVDESSSADSEATDSEAADSGRPADRGAVDESSSADSGQIEEAPLEEAGRSARKADAFMDLINAGLASADSGHAAGDDRYMVHMVTRDGGHSYRFLNGTPVGPIDATMISCDRSTISHLVAESGEPLSLGRKTRDWNTAQRRAISVRDAGQCRFPGCTSTHYDIHHMRSWEAGGHTDIANGHCECRRHHRMLHAGYRVQGDPNGELRFYRPNDSYIGSTYPAAARTPDLASAGRHCSAR
jgi:hypothetical protein